MAIKHIEEIRRRIKSKVWLFEVVASKKAGKMSDRLGAMFIELTKRYAHGPNFKGFTYNEDIIGGTSSWYKIRSWSAFFLIFFALS